MAKKQKEETPNVNSTANRDVVQRLNFLYQASVYLQSIAPPPSSQTVNEGGDTRKLNEDKCEGSSTGRGTTERAKTRRKRKAISMKSTADLARSYVQCMHVVGQKTTVKMDPSIKRTLCSGCSTTLVPGSSASVRVKSSATQGHAMIYTCLHCKTSKRIPASQTISPSSNHAPPPSIPQNMTSGPTDEGETSTAIDTATAPPSEIKSNTKSKKALSRQPPLFSRLDAGHVVFRGNSVLPVDPQSGFGAFLV